MPPIPVLPADRPMPAGHYSPAMRHGDLLFISGQLPGPGDARSVAADFESQTRAVLASLLEILAAAGGTPADLVKVTAYLVGTENWGRFNGVYAETFGEARPARAVVPVPALHHGYLVEVEAIAAIAPR